MVVGCPVRGRAWVMEDWFAHTKAALLVAGIPATFAFVAPAGDETLPIIAEHTGGAAVLTLVDEPSEYVERQWHREERIHHMVELRNLLLASVRALAPVAFISIDSDVLVHPNTIAELLEGLGRFDAVGGCTYMTPLGTQFPSCGWLLGKSGLMRKPIEQVGVFPVDVIMALKAMSPAAYSIDYAYAREGEDIGWSAAAAAAGLKLGWDSRHVAKHVMGPEALDPIDQRCGF